MLSDQGTRCALVRARPDEDETQYAARATVNVLSMRGAGGLAIRRQPGRGRMTMAPGGHDPSWRPLLEQAGQAAVGQRLAAGLAGRGGLQRGGGETDPLDSVRPHPPFL